MSNDSPEFVGLMAVAKAQFELYRATQILLNDDKHDGLKMAELTRVHSLLLRKSIDEWSLSEKEEDEILAAAGEKQ